MLQRYVHTDILVTFSITSRICIASTGMHSFLYSGTFVNEYTLYSVVAGVEVDFTRSQLLSGLPAAAFCLWYVLKKHWLANNTLGLAFSIQVLDHHLRHLVYLSHIYLISISPQIEMLVVSSWDEAEFGYIDDPDIGIKRARKQESMCSRETILDCYVI